MKHCYVFISLLFTCFASTAEEWRPLGNATIVDGWITPGYVDDAGKQIDPNTCPFEVPVEENTATPGVYRLKNPFGGKGFHLSEFNIDPSDQDIIIDARDRTFVIIQGQYCGFTDADSSEPSGRYAYYLSDMGTYMYNLGQQREVINILKCSSVMVDNTIIVRQPTFGTSADKAIQAWDPSYTATITLPDNSEEDEAMWESMCATPATVTDGWITPGFKDDNGNAYIATEHTFTCPIDFNTDNPNLISLDNPYRSNSFFMAYSNLSSRRSRIVFDVTDPELVLVNPQFSGYIYREDNDINAMYITDAGTLLLSRGTSKEEIIAKGYNATYVDGKIVVPQPLFGFDIENVGKMWNNPQPSVIEWAGAGVHDIDSDNADCAVEYFNLQGIKVAEPVHGNLYIRRQGTDIRKIVY